MPPIKSLTEKSDSWVILDALPENVMSIKRTKLSVFKDSEASSVDQLLSTQTQKLMTWDNQEAELSVPLSHLKNGNEKPKCISENNKKNVKENVLFILCPRLL